MDCPEFLKLRKLAATEEALEATTAYMERNLRRFLKQQERVLICFPSHGRDKVSGILEAAVRRAGGIPIFGGPDYRWKALLKQAFSTRATVLAGAPLVILGLTKLARAENVPLFARNVLLAGYPCLDWMKAGIQRFLDCQIWDCYTLGAGPVIGGFSCGNGRGVHIRDAVYQVEIRDGNGEILPPGELGEVVLSLTEAPEIRYHTMERGRLERMPCPCGCMAPKLVDLGPGRDVDPELARVGAELQYWTSVLDCRLQRGPCGLEAEVVVFPGEKLPPFPNFAKRIIRPWDPETDIPFWFAPGWKNVRNGGESH